MSSIDLNLYSPQTQMDNANALLGYLSSYNLATALTGRDAFGRCLSTPDRLLRGVSAALPMLSKLRGLGGATRLAGEAGCSFAAGTPVVMADGTSRTIETLHAGDYVLAKDEKTGKVEAQEVTATVHHPAATLVTVTFAGADGKTQAIVCTPEHPFFVDGKGWVEAGSLGVGTSIVTRAGSPSARQSPAHSPGSGRALSPVPGLRCPSRGWTGSGRRRPNQPLRSTTSRWTKTTLSSWALPTEGPGRTIASVLLGHSK